MIGIGWLERVAADAPEGDAWLASGERDRQAGMRWDKRRSDWRLGRYTAKAAIAVWLEACGEGVPGPERMEIWNDDDGAPWARIDGDAAPFVLSLSHSHGRGLCAVAPQGTLVGCDLERIEPRSRAFVDQFLAPAERAFARAVPSDRDRRATLVWSAKESAVKALGCGLSVDTRDVEISIDQPRPTAGRQGWHPLSAQLRTGGPTPRLRGWWSESAGHVRTLLTSPPAAEPFELRAEEERSVEAL